MIFSNNSFNKVSNHIYIGQEKCTQTKSKVRVRDNPNSYVPVVHQSVSNLETETENEQIILNQNKCTDSG